jgi:hypothetical protein
MSQTITLTPASTPIVILETGGTFDYNIEGANTAPTPVSADVWCDVTLPDGSIYGPVLGPVNVLLPATSSLNRDRTQNVPAGAPIGPYTYNAYIGVYPDLIWDEDTFPFVKIADDAGGASVRNWANSGESFDIWLAETEAEIPGQFALHAAFPNPFNPITGLSFSLPEAALVQLTVFDVSGRQVAKLVDGWRDAGVHDVIFDAAGLPSGIYIARLQTESFSTSQKMVLVK